MRGRIIKRKWSISKMAIRNGKSYLMRQITVVDDMTDEGLTAIAWPLIDPDAGATKVAQVILLSRDGHLLEPQIEKANPVTVEHFHRHI